MEPELQQQQGENIMAGFATPPLPTTTTEFITALAHYHRAEIARMAGWRDRIDRTTNWAITGVAAMLSLSLSSPTAHHGVLLFAMLLVMLLLLIEARRYRFFDVYRASCAAGRAELFRPDVRAGKGLDQNWAHTLGEDFRAPKFLMSLGTAMSRRLRRNYFWMFFILLLAWVVKITSPKLQEVGARQDFVTSLQEIVGNANLGSLPGWMVLVAVAVFYGWVIYVAFRTIEKTGELSYGNVHV